METMIYKSPEGIQALNLEEHHIKRINEALRFWDEVTNYVPCNVYIRYEEVDGKNYLDDVSVRLTKHIEIRRHYNGNVHICYCGPLLKGEDNAARTKAAKVVEAPRNFKVLNAKKIINWIEYVNKIRANIDLILRERKEKESNFLARVRSISSIDGINLVEDEDGKGGRLESEYFSFRFNLEGDYISQDIDFSFSAKYKDGQDYLDLFKKLIT